MARYANRGIAKNDNEQYREVLKKKGLKFIRQYFTGKLHHPTVAEIGSIKIKYEVWSHGSSFMKLAEKYYNGDPTLWYLIAWWNQKPTPFHVEIGQTIEIPTPLDEVLRVLRTE